MPAPRLLSPPPQNLRAVYDRNGSKMVDKEGGIGMEDAAGFFANVFGGERFKDYVSRLLLLFFPVLGGHGNSATLLCCAHASNAGLELQEQCYPQLPALSSFPVPVQHI